jgi:nucleoside-diphosphate-sugar epimerase
MAPQLSVREQLEGRCVLITGGLGFLGSVCLEQLLRLSKVRVQQLAAASLRTYYMDACDIRDVTVLCVRRCVAERCTSAVGSAAHCGCVQVMAPTPGPHCLLGS